MKEKPRVSHGTSICIQGSFFACVQCRCTQMYYIFSHELCHVCQILITTARWDSVLDFYSITQFVFTGIDNFLNSSLHNASGTPAEHLFMAGPNTKLDGLNPGSLTRARCTLYVNFKVSVYRWMSYFICTYYF